MKVIDLTHTIEAGMPVFPGTEPPVLMEISDYDRDGYKERRLEMTTHTGTHLDPPAHVRADGQTVDQLLPEQFIGRALVIECSDLKNGEAIEPERICRHEGYLQQADFLLFHTGWDRYWGTPEYFKGYPCLSEASVDMIREGHYKGIGFDAIGIDPVEDAALSRHHRLFQDGRRIVIVENLTGLDQCGNVLFWFSCFPLKLACGDGAPVRAMAWFEALDEA